MKYDYKKNQRKMDNRKCKEGIVNGTKTKIIRARVPKCDVN